VVLEDRVVDPSGLNTQLTPTKPTLDLERITNIMALDFSAASSALKDDYQPAIREQLNNSIMLLNQVETNTADVEGTEAVISLHTGRNTGVGARAESGTLPTAGQQAYSTARIPVKFNYGRIQITGPVIEGMKSDRGSFTRAIDSESKGIVADLKRDVNRQLYTPNSGIIGTIVADSGGHVVTFATEAEVRRMEVGQSFDFYDGDYATDDTGEVVASRDISGKSVTFTGLHADVSAGDWVVRSGVVPVAITSKATEETNYEIHGLEDIVTNGTGTAGSSAGLASPWLHGINGTATTVWASSQTDSVGVPTDSAFEQICDEVNLESGEDIDLGIVSHKGARAYANTLKTQKRFTNSVELKGGFSAITFQTGRGEVALWAERDCLDDVAFLVNTAHLTHWVMSDWSFMDRDGSVLSRVANGDSYEATLYKYHEFGTDRRNAHGKLTGLTV
tara:strand:- start:2614 stop:3957 length:1344 start_codon:yes stop_codon:yes gene_type:complete